MNEKLIEVLADLEHKQWIYWSKSLSKDLITLKKLIENNELDNALHLIEDKLDNWKVNWKPYDELSESVKEYDRVWANEILDNLPFKCPIYQCGGVMVMKERPYLKGMSEDDFPDGIAGDFQTPDLVCTNCKAIYHFDGFKKILR